jgi:cytochrome c-type biogenesis protein CcmF
MVEIGHFALVLALALALVQTTVPLIGARIRHDRMMAVAGPVALTGFALTALSFVALVTAYAGSDFSVKTV